jgi:hypothetical protein
MEHELSVVDHEGVMLLLLKGYQWLSAQASWEDQHIHDDLATPTPTCPDVSSNKKARLTPALRSFTALVDLSKSSSGGYQISQLFKWAARLPQTL